MPCARVTYLLFTARLMCRHGSNPTPHPHHTNPTFRPRTERPSADCSSVFKGVAAPARAVAASAILANPADRISSAFAHTSVKWCAGSSRFQSAPSQYAPLPPLPFYPHLYSANTRRTNMCMCIFVGPDATWMSWVWCAVVVLACGRR